jgi:hypothetical protein
MGGPFGNPYSGKPPPIERKCGGRPKRPPQAGSLPHKQNRWRYKFLIHAIETLSFVTGWVPSMIPTSESFRKRGRRRVWKTTPQSG